MFTKFRSLSFLSVFCEPALPSFHMLFSVLIRLHLKKKIFEEVKTTRTVVSYLKEVAHQHDTRRYIVWYGHSEGMQKLKS